MSLRHAVLGLLSSGPSSGYDLLKTFEASLANVWPATQSQLYGELVKMADAGLIEVIAEGPRGRKEYAVTEAGRAELQHWMTEVEPERLRRHDMLLRVFFLNRLTPEQARDYLRRQQDRSAQLYAQLEKVREGLRAEDGDLARYGDVALEWGLRFHALNRDWAEWASAQLKD